MPLARTKARLTLAKLYSIAGTGYMYYYKRPRTNPKLELVKYDPLGKKCSLFNLAGRHCLFTENKPQIPDFPDYPPTKKKKNDKKKK
jgi:ribosomal protein L33